MLLLNEIQKINLSPHQWVLCFILAALFIYLLTMLIIHRLKLIAAISEMLSETSENALSSTRFIMLFAFTAVIGVWLFISLWELKLTEIAASIITLLGSVATLKYMQKREETKQENTVES